MVASRTNQEKRIWDRIRTFEESFMGEQLTAPHRQFSSLRTVDFDRLKLVTGQTEEIAAWLESAAVRTSSDRLIVGHVNLYNYFLMNRKNPYLPHIPLVYSLIFEGIGMKAAYAALHREWLHDANGTDLAPLVLQQLEKRNARLFFLGGAEDVIEKAVSNCRRLYPGLHQIGYHHGYFAPEENARVLARITEERPDMLFLGMGPGLAEAFVLDSEKSLNVPVVWIVGGLFDFMSGAKRRAPIWLRKVRLEWLYRFLREPRRMAFRNTVAPAWLIIRILGSMNRGRTGRRLTLLPCLRRNNESQEN